METNEIQEQEFPIDDIDDYFDEEKEWEKHCDYQHFLRHGNDPWWAQ
jgi:hypothetical protein